MQDFLEGGCRDLLILQQPKTSLAKSPCFLALPPTDLEQPVSLIFPCPPRTGPIWDFTQEAPEVVTQPNGSHVGTPCVESWLCPFLVRRSSISCGSGPSAGTVRQKQPGPPVWSHGVWLWFWGGYLVVWESVSTHVSQNQAAQCWVNR